MGNLLTIALEAHHDALNHHRHDRTTVGRDLLADWTVNISYGRVGQRGQGKQFGSSDVDAMHKIVREHLRRRLSAPERIGCAYRITTVNWAEGFDGEEWLPELTERKLMLFVMLCLVAFGLSRMFKYAKNNPSHTIQAASLIRRWLGK